MTFTLEAGRARRAALTAILAVLIVMAALAARLPSSPLAMSPRVQTPSTLDPRVATLAGRAGGTEIEVIAEFAPTVSAERARGDIAAVGGRTVAQLHIIPALAVRLTAAQAVRLAKNPDLRSVALNARVRTTGDPSQTTATYGQDLGNTFAQSLDAPGLWRAGGTGAGIGVAVIDTGVDGALPDFASSAGGGSRVVATAAANPGAQTADDSYGHGTDVAGIIAGDSSVRPASDPLHDQFVGVAPQAKVISVKVSDEQGGATVLDVIYGLQFAVDFQHRYGIRVINLSLDAEAAQSYTQDPLDAAVESAWRHGIVVVVAAGNRGTASDAVDYAPANDPYVITVGAVDENRTAKVIAHTVAPWSSQGTTQDGFAKPDVYAPGAHIVSELAPGSAFASLCPTCVVDGQYIRASGTSFAAPMISGLVADVLDLHPRWTPDEVKGALLDPSARTSASPEVDALKVAELSAPAPANQGLEPNRLIAGASGELDYARASWSRASWSLTSWDRASWSRASWSLADWARASWSRASWSRASWSTASWASLPG